MGTAEEWAFTLPEVPGSGAGVEDGPSPRLETQPWAGGHEFGLG